MTPETISLTGAEGNLLAADKIGPNDGAPVLLAHGFGQSRHSWRAAGEALAKRGYCAIYYDLRGHGDSDRTSDYGPLAHTADMRAIVSTFDTPPMLVGASLGGLAALQLVGDKETPVPARALVLVDIGHRIKASSGSPVRQFMLDTASGFDTLDDAVHAIATYLPHRQGRKPGAGLTKTLIQRDDGRWYWRWDPAMMQTELRPEFVAKFSDRLEACLRRVTAPTLVVRGGNSEMLSRETAEEMVEILQNGAFVEVEGAHHMVAGDDNNAFMNALLEFIDKLEH